MSPAFAAFSLAAKPGDTPPLAAVLTHPPAHCRPASSKLQYATFDNQRREVNMTTQCTQGGWYISPEYPCHVQIEKSGADGRTWGCVVANCDSSDFLTDEEKRANAQLVAAAPDLLEA